MHKGKRERKQFRQRINAAYEIVHLAQTLCGTHTNTTPELTRQYLAVAFWLMDTLAEKFSNTQPIEGQKNNRFSAASSVRD